MAIAHDTVTRFPADGNITPDTTSGDRTFTHTPSGTPRGVIVLVAGASTSDIVTGVLYGGTAMTLIVSATDTDEAGKVHIYFLGASVPAGAQTVTLQGCVAAGHCAFCNTVTAATTTTAVDVFGSDFQSAANNPGKSLTTTTTTMSYAIVSSGQSAPTALTIATGCTELSSFGIDYGSTVSKAARRSSADAAGTFTVGFTATADDFCAAAVAIKETAAAGPTFIPQIIIVS